MGAQWKAKHKEVAANAKGRIFGKLSKEIMVAARAGADPSMNPRLRLAVVTSMVLPLAVLQENIVGWPAAHLAKAWGANSVPVAIPSNSHFVMCVFKKITMLLIAL